MAVGSHTLRASSHAPAPVAGFLQRADQSDNGSLTRACDCLVQRREPGPHSVGDNVIPSDPLSSPSAAFARRAPGRTGFHATLRARGGSRRAADVSLEGQLARVSCTYRITNRKSAYVKGYRTPAKHGRRCGTGRRPVSLKGGNRGEVSAAGGAGLWEFGHPGRGEVGCLHWPAAAIGVSFMREIGARQ